MFSLKQLEQLRANLARLGSRRLAVLATVGLAVTMAVGVATRYLIRPAMQTIYSGLSAQDVSRMTEALAEVGMPFDVNEQRNAVLVPFGQASRARSHLAQKGLPASTRAGYELFDQMGSMGLTSFMQEVTKVRVLEGEIARTIQALNGVGAARVHLVLPDPGSFRRERRDPSASVLLKVDGRWQGAGGQTVRHIVAAAVPGMKIENVSVASTDGRLLSIGGDPKTLGSIKLSEMERSMAEELEQRASRTLTTALGAGNYQISVTVRLDVDRQQVNETVYDPKSRVERSVRAVKQSGSSDEASSKAATGVEANLPREESNQVEGDKRRQREDRREELVNYEMNTKTVQTTREGYRVQRLAIAVVADRKQIASQIGSNADAAAIDARLVEIKRLVAAATGAVPDGSIIEVSAVDFRAVESSVSATPSPGIMDYVLMNLGLIVNAVAMLLIVVVVVTFGMRPLTSLLAKVDPPVPPALAQPLAAQALPAGATSGPALAAALGQDGRTAAAPAIGTQGGHGAKAIPSKKDAMIRERLEGMIEADDAKVATVLKDWMTEARQT